MSEVVIEPSPSKNDEYVYSELQSTATCWDLGRTAMEEALKAGYHIEHGDLGSPYAWSKKVVPYKEAQPGDIAQFAGWQEGFMWAGNPHTAVVVRPYDKETDHHPTIHTMDQNPDPVHETDYHPTLRESGRVTIYRIEEFDSSSRLYSASVPKLLSTTGMSAKSLGLCAVCALVVALTVGLATKRRWKRPVAQAGDPEQALMVLPANHDARGEAQLPESAEENSL
jgi:hypothetical protein